MQHAQVMSRYQTTPLLGCNTAFTFFQTRRTQNRVLRAQKLYCSGDVQIQGLHGVDGNSFHFDPALSSSM